MNTFLSKKTLGIVAACTVFLFAFSVTAPAMAKKVTLNSMLKSSGVSFKLVRLDRTDGFWFGLSFSGKRIPTIILAPGLNRLFLVQVNGNDTILQGDGTGKMQLVQANGDLGTALCILSSVVEFLTNLQTCTGDLVCLFTQIIALITGIMTCTGTTTTTTTIAAD